MDVAEVTKVKRLNEETTVLWETPNLGARTKHALEDCGDTPNKDFLDQMATVEADLIARTGFGKKFAERLTLTGITMSRNSAGRRQFKPSAKLDIGWGETGISLPLMLAPDSDKPEAGNVLTDVEVKNIETLFELGLEYAQGERHQKGLALDGEGDDPDGGGDGEDPFAKAAAA